MPMERAFGGSLLSFARKTAERRLEPPWTAGIAILVAVESDLD